jgi:hypothetical protein
MNEMPLEAPSMQAGVLRGLVLLTNSLIDIVYLRWDLGPTILHAFLADHELLSADAGKGIVRGEKGDKTGERGQECKLGLLDAALRLGLLEEHRWR